MILEIFKVVVEFRFLFFLFFLVESTTHVMFGFIRHS